MGVRLGARRDSMGATAANPLVLEVRARVRVRVKVRG